MHFLFKITERHAHAHWYDTAQHTEAIKRRDRDEIEETEEQVHHTNERREHRERIGALRIRDAEDYREQDRNKEVREDSGGSDERLAPALVPEVIRVIGHRLGPAEHEASIRYDQEGWDNDRTNRVDVWKRVEGEASGKLCGPVSEPVGGVAVGHLMEDDRKNKDDDGEAHQGEFRLHKDTAMVTSWNYGTKLRSYRKDDPDRRTVLEPDACYPVQPDG